MDLNLIILSYNDVRKYLQQIAIILSNAKSTPYHFLRLPPLRKRENHDPFFKNDIWR